MKRTEKGITFTSFLIVLVVLGFFALITMKLFPMYSEYYSVKRVMNELAAMPKAPTMSGNDVQIELERRFDIAYVDSVKKEHVKIIRAGKGSKLNIAYEVRVPLLGNLDAVGRFDNTVDMTGTSAGG